MCWVNKAWSKLTKNKGNSGEAQNQRWNSVAMRAYGRDRGYIGKCWLVWKAHCLCIDCKKHWHFFKNKLFFHHYLENMLSPVDYAAVTWDCLNLHNSNFLLNSSIYSAKNTQYINTAGIILIRSCRGRSKYWIELHPLQKYCFLFLINYQRDMCCSTSCFFFFFFR